MGNLAINGVVLTENKSLNGGEERIEEFLWFWINNSDFCMILLWVGVCLIEMLGIFQSKKGPEDSAKLSLKM